VEAVYRFLLSGRWIALLIVGLILVVAFTLAGFWQLGKFRSPASAGPGSGTVTEATADPQNLGYALQWWAFAGATIYFGIRAIRMEAEDRLMPPEQPPAQPPEESDAARP
jgi:cytochrome oxidase assembly protein ShyY1